MNVLQRISLPVLLSLSLGLTATLPAFAQTLTRGPYLQSGAPTNVVLRWRTSTATIGVVRYGTIQGSLTVQRQETAARIGHEVRLTDLTPNTRYYYSVGTTIAALAGEGAVYVVAGSSGQISGGTFNHPAMFIALNNLGSMVLDVNGNRLDARFLRENGAAPDHFTILKGAPVVSLTSPANSATLRQWITLPVDSREDPAFGKGGKQVYQWDLASLVITNTGLAAGTQSVTISYSAGLHR